jgi:histidinol phosphatase-like enzyme
MEVKNKTIILDRDGVINDNSVAYYVYKTENFIINSGVIKSLKLFQSKRLSVNCNNQPGWNSQETI